MEQFIELREAGGLEAGFIDSKVFLEVTNLHLSGVVGVQTLEYFSDLVLLFGETSLHLFKRPVVLQNRLKDAGSH